METYGYAVSASKIDKIGEALRSANYCSNDLVELDNYRRIFQPSYEKVLGVIRGTLRLDVTGRPSKSTGSISDKLRRETTRLSQMQDIAGCRVVVEDIPAQDKLIKLLDVFLLAPKIVDRRRSPSNGYRAVHLLATVGGLCVEVQIRTRPQHLWAEISEKMADTIDPQIKYGKGDSRALSLLRKLSAAVQSLEDGENNRANALGRIGNFSGQQRKPIKKELRELERNYLRMRAETMDVLSKMHQYI